MKKKKNMEKGKFNYTTIQSIDKVWMFIWKRLMRKNRMTKKMGVVLDKRPQVFNTLWIAKGTGLTYSQVRYAIDILVLNNFLKKWVVKDPKQYSKMYLQLDWNRWETKKALIHRLSTENDPL